MLGWQFKARARCEQTFFKITYTVTKGYHYIGRTWVLKGHSSDLLLHFSEVRRRILKISVIINGVEAEIS